MYFNFMCKPHQGLQFCFHIAQVVAGVRPLQSLPRMQDLGCDGAGPNLRCSVFLVRTEESLQITVSRFCYFLKIIN